MTVPGASSDAGAWLAEADRLHHAKQFTEAAAHYREALARDPSLFDAWYGLGFAQGTVGEHGDAVEALRRALALNPNATRLRINLAEALFALGRVSDALREYDRAATEGDSATRDLAARNRACLAPGDPAYDNQAILTARLDWAEEQARGVRPMRHLGWHPGRQLKIGYYGTFFGDPNWMKMYMGVINAHDRDRFEVNLIVDGDVPSAKAGYRDHPDDRIWEVDGVSNEDLAGHIAEAKLDVLIDLNGYSHQARMGLLPYRAAPVQIAWNGMYATTGFASVDCLIGDAAVIPPEEERFCVERVRRVPHTYLAFDMFYPTPEPAPAPFAHVGHVTFGALVSAYKVTDAVVASWSRILHGVPDARLLLRNRGLGRASNRADILARFAANGIGPERLTLEGGGAHDDFLRTYERIDIALDTFPYSGATTTAEAIWQGVPVLTFDGGRWVSRTSRSILAAAGLMEWVASDQAGYEALAVRMARAPEALAAIRPNLRARVARSPACDTKGLCLALETIYREEVAAKAGQEFA